MDTSLFNQTLDNINPEQSAFQLESGSILFFPTYYYEQQEQSLMTDSILDSRHKNISYDYMKNKLGAFNNKLPDVKQQLLPFLRGYAEFSLHLIKQVLPFYVPHLIWGRTSFRPAQIQGRSSSIRKDDTRLHVDSFSASPANGLRILRVFCNINPYGEPRVWNVGEPFTKVLEQFATGIPEYSKFKARLLKVVKATKSLRSPYDHYMLHLHDSMKLDEEYQKRVSKKQINFPSYSSWIVFTDHVSHAALSGQYLLEQTFYLSVDKMKNPELSPLYELKKIKPQLESMSTLTAY